MKKLDRTAFAAGLRPLYGGSLTKAQVETLDQMADSWERVFAEHAEAAAALFALCMVEVPAPAPAGADAVTSTTPATLITPIETVETGADAVVASTELTDDDFARAAIALDCDEAAVRAVVQIEAGGSGFLADGRPKILYEAHVFHRLTNGRFGHETDRDGVPLSVSKWDRTLYGRTGDHQWNRLEDAAMLDWEAAHAACSWGAAQIMGSNYKAAGFNGVEDFVTGMKTGGAAMQLDAMVSFIKANKLDDNLREHDWAGFARGYNGSGYAQNKYDTKLAEAHRQWA